MATDVYISINVDHVDLLMTNLYNSILYQRALFDQKVTDGKRLAKLYALASDLLANPPFEGYETFSSVPGEENPPLALAALMRSISLGEFQNLMMEVAGILKKAGILNG